MYSFGDVAVVDVWPFSNRHLSLTRKLEPIQSKPPTGIQSETPAFGGDGADVHLRRGRDAVRRTADAPKDRPAAKPEGEPPAPVPARAAFLSVFEVLPRWEIPATNRSEWENEKFEVSLLVEDATRTP